MSNVIRLTKLFLKDGFGNKENQSTKERGNYKKILLGIFIFICLIPLMGTISFGTKEIYEILKPMGQESLIVGALVMSTFSVVLIFGILISISVLYFSSDIESILHLPLKVREIVSAKFITILTHEYAFVLFITGTIGGTYGYLESAGPIYWIKLVVVTIILPIMPLSIACILCIFLMKFNFITRNKDRFNMLIGIVGMGLAIVFNIGLQKMTRLPKDELMERLGNGDSLASTLFNNPLIKAPMNFLSQNDIGSASMNFIFFVVFTIGIFLIYIIIAEAFYLKSAMSISSSSSKRKKISEVDLSKQSEKKSQIIAYMMKEIKLLLRTPAFFMNCVLVEILLPVFLLIPAIANGIDITAIKEGLSKAREFVSSNASETVALFAIGTFVITIFVAGSAIVSGTSITREGGSFYVNKFLPISAKHQIIGKLLSGVLINSIVLVYIIIINLVLGTPIINFVVSITTCILTIILINITQILFDIIKPKLDWTNEYKAVKQNLMIFIMMMFNFGVAGAVGVITLINFKNIGENGLIITSSIIAILVIFIAIMYNVVMSYGIKKYEKI